MGKVKKKKKSNNNNNNNKKKIKTSTSEFLNQVRQRSQNMRLRK
jgi:hypothetical protein